MLPLTRRWKVADILPPEIDRLLDLSARTKV